MGEPGILHFNKLSGDGDAALSHLELQGSEQTAC